MQRAHTHEPSGMPMAHHGYGRDGRDGHPGGRWARRSRPNYRGDEISSLRHHSVWLVYKNGGASTLLFRILELNIATEHEPRVVTPTKKIDMRPTEHFVPPHDEPRGNATNSGSLERQLWIRSLSAKAFKEA
jgi:hypothetical protein